MLVQAEKRAPSPTPVHSYFFFGLGGGGRLIVSTTEPFLSAWACFTVLNLPVPASRPIFICASIRWRGIQLPSGDPVAAEAATGVVVLLVVDQPAERALAILASVDARSIRQGLPRATHPPLSAGRWRHEMPPMMGGPMIFASRISMC